jgi:NifU-like protein involved in Fe-S cluster formation
MLTDKVKGMSREAIRALGADDMNELYGVEIGPQREKCAMLAMNTLKEAIEVR